MQCIGLIWMKKSKPSIVVPHSTSVSTSSLWGMAKKGVMPAMSWLGSNCWPAMRLPWWCWRTMCACCPTFRQCCKRSLICRPRAGTWSSCMGASTKKLPSRCRWPTPACSSSRTGACPALRRRMLLAGLGRRSCWPVGCRLGGPWMSICAFGLRTACALLAYSPAWWPWTTPVPRAVFGRGDAIG